MPQPVNSQSTYNEGRLLLAKRAIEQGQFQSVRSAAKSYNVNRMTLKRRCDGMISQHDYEPKVKKLSKLEESVIIQYILELDSRGFPPKLSAVRDMANKLLADRNGGQVGINWPNNFVRRTPELKTRFNRKYDYRRAKCEDPEVITQWFELVRRVVEKYGIAEEDTYNFDEIGFLMGVISTGMVVTASERRNQPKLVQPGNREWVTVIHGVNSQGWAIPPFIIFKGTYHLSAWFEEELPLDWRLTLSDNGWTNNELGLEWIKHFEKYTKSRTTGAYRLLVIDGHESHNSLEFRQFCEENKIITLCMPPHSSHLLQPLDVGCFAPLKKAYGNEVENLMRNHINHITKLEFLPAFKAAFNDAITKDNIHGAFRGAGLVPYDPEAVLSKLDIKLKTPTPPAEDTLPWVSKTPQNPIEMTSQSELIKNKIVRHQDSSPTPINEALDQLVKGAQAMVHKAVLLKAELASFRMANEAATRRKRRQKKRIQHRGSLTIGEGRAIIDPDTIRVQVPQEIEGEAGRVEEVARKQRQCRVCGATGHNARTCQKEQENTLE